MNFSASVGREPHGERPSAINCRYWLITSTTYGSWLPGDARNFTGELLDSSGKKVIRNIPGPPYEQRNSALEQHARSLLKCDPIRLDAQQAKALLQQLQETADHRGWLLLAVGIMTNHFHLVVGVPGDPLPKKILGDFKSYGSRALNRQWTKPASGTWWTDSGSKRKLADETAVQAAVRYVMNQEHPLLIWTAAIPELNLPGGRIV